MILFGPSLRASPLSSWGRTNQVPTGFMNYFSFGSTQNAVEYSLLIWRKHASLTPFLLVVREILLISISHYMDVQFAINSTITIYQRWLRSRYNDVIWLFFSFNKSHSLIFQLRLHQRNEDILTDLFIHFIRNVEHMRSVLHSRLIEHFISSFNFIIWVSISR